MKIFNKKIGLALGGGGAKGLAHIGVLKYLEEKNISIDYVAGTSIGAIIGALYCLGHKASEIEKIAKTTDFKKLFDPTLPKKGLIKGEKVELYLRHLFENKKFSELKKPLYIIASDLTNFQEVIFKEGDLTKAVRASISIPGIFHPVINKKTILVDGGLVNNLPIKTLKNKADFIIAVNLEGKELKKEKFQTAEIKNETIEIPNIFETLINSYLIAEANQLKEIIKGSKNTIILSPDLEKTRTYSFNKIDETIKKGYEIAKQNKRRLKKLKKKRWFLKNQ